MRSLEIMRQYTDRVVMDCTHAVQLPGGNGTSSGGQRQYVPLMARAAVGVGVSAVFIETHRSPEDAPSDGANMLYLSEFPHLLSHLLEIDYIVKRKKHG
jgi:2-dehydro-3-deoxyphosphooctonate aldolase (KDO 8-P synthase)